MSFFLEGEKHLFIPSVAEVDYQVYPVRVEIAPNEGVFDSRAAQIIVDLIQRKPDASLFLSTGTTPENKLDLLKNAVLYGLIDISWITTFNQDEYWRIDPNHPGSYRSYMVNRLFWDSQVRWHIPKGDAEDPLKEAKRYEELIRDFVKTHGPIDLAVLGAGPSGAKFLHLGFNEPGRESTRQSVTRLVNLDEKTIGVNREIFKRLEQESGWTGETAFPTQAITVGIGTVLDNSQNVLVMLKGKGKADGAYNMLFRPLGPENPAGWIRTHPGVTVLLDENAASLVKPRL